MAHQYDSFSAAYSALYSGYNAAVTDWNYASDHWLAWQVHFNAGQYDSAQYDLARCVQRLMWAVDHIFGFYSGYFYNSLICENIYWANKDVEVGEVTMSAILEAMYNAEPHQPLLFVAYLEAYYASTWNATFNEQELAELVKKWAIWG